MMKTIKKIIEKNGGTLCALAMLVATAAQYSCRGSWYQPEEPEGLKEFCNKKK